MRRVLAILAIASVLLHAAALVRHAYAVVDTTLGHQQLAADLRVLCQGLGGTTHLTEDESLPTSFDRCPICAGLAGFSVLPPPDLVLLGNSADARSAEHTAIAVLMFGRCGQRLPPVRGPPAQA